jgi:translation initiation factor IF-3
MAMEKAREAELDLVEVSPTSDPPVCRIMDYGKWLYEQKRKVRESLRKSLQHTGTLKEIRIRPETDKHDIEIKINHAREFLQKGHKVQFTMFFKGRQILHPEIGHEVFGHITRSLEDVAKLEHPGKITNRRLALLLVPK